MKTRFTVNADGKITADFRPIHPKLEKELDEAKLTMGDYEIDVIKLPVNNFPKGAWVKIPGAKITKVNSE